MNIEVDTHTHTVLSGHAHSTILENAAAAAKLGLAGLVMTEHGPAFPLAPPEFNVTTYRYLPTHMEGVRLYGGIEANIIDFDGGIDLAEKYLERLQFVIAGLHVPVMASGGLQKDTDTLVAALSNKYVDMISHPDHPAYQLDYQTLAKEAARMGKILEINSQSLEYRQGTMENADLMVKWCKRYDTRVAVSSDAHSAYGIGRFGVALRLLEDNGFPEELVINVSQARFEKYIEERAGRIGA
jgi:putative hydrolase